MKYIIFELRYKIHLGQSDLVPYALSYTPCAPSQKFDNSFATQGEAEQFLETNPQLFRCGFFTVLPFYGSPNVSLGENL